MEKCKYCQEELAEGTTLCPHCGKDNAAEEPADVTSEEKSIFGEELPVVRVPAQEAEEQMPVEQVEEKEPQIQQGIVLSPAKLVMGIVAVVVLTAALVALVISGLANRNTVPAETAPAETTMATEETVPATVPADGNPDDATCKGSYTVSDEEVKAHADTVVATMGDKQLTNSQLQVYYWNMVNSYLNSETGYYLMAYGMLDYTKPLDTQLCVEDNGMTWQQYFLANALDYWQLHQSLAEEAQAAGMEMSQEEREYLDNLETTLTDLAEGYGLANVDELLLRNVGPGATLADFAHFQNLYYTGKPYYLNKTEAMVPTQADLEAHFAQHESEYAEQGITKEGDYVDVRHILLTVEGGTTDEAGTTTYTDAEWEACRVKAQAVLDAWLAGEKTEDSFAALANEKSEDPGSNTNGGLYENVYVGQMVEPFEDWCFDESRTYGDCGLVQTSYGYHVMFFVNKTPIWQTAAESGWVTEQANLLVEQLEADHPIDMDYSAIKLGYINLGA